MTVDLREWLTAVGVRNGSTPGNAKHYTGFAAQVRKDFPRLPLTDATAYAVGEGLGGQFPTWEELRGSIRAVMTEAEADAPKDEGERVTAMWVRYFHRRVRETPDRRAHLLSLLRKVDMAAFNAVVPKAEQEAEAARMDREWWERRISAIADLPHATEAWREAMGTLAVLTRPGAYRRQWAIDRLSAIVANTAEAGADTSIEAVRFPVETRIAPPPAPKMDDAA